MCESLSPKEIARIKLAHRKSKIRQLRQVVATGAVVLVVLFSGVILTRSLTGRQSPNQASATALSQSQNTDSKEGDEESDDSEDSNILTNVAAGITSAATSPDSAPSPKPVTTSQS